MHTNSLAHKSSSHTTQTNDEYNWNEVRLEFGIVVWLVIFGSFYISPSPPQLLWLWLFVKKKIIEEWWFFMWIAVEIWFVKRFSSLFTPLNCLFNSIQLLLQIMMFTFLFWESHNEHWWAHTVTIVVLCIRDVIVYHRQTHKCTVKNKKTYNHRWNRTSASERCFFSTKLVKNVCNFKLFLFLSNCFISPFHFIWFDFRNSIRNK